MNEDGQDAYRHRADDEQIEPDTEHRSDLHGHTIPPSVFQARVGERFDFDIEQTADRWWRAFGGSPVSTGAQGQGHIPRTLLSAGNIVTDWFKPRRYRHFDRPVCEEFAATVQKPDFVVRHSFSPFIRYVKSEKRFKKGEHKTVLKTRPIMFASHRDACILSWYARILNFALETFYREHGIGNCVIAYRSLGKGNYDFAASAHAFASAHAPVEILTFDITGFFDNLDHRRLKARLKEVLGTSELSTDWYNVFRIVTQYHFVALTDLTEHPEFSERIKQRDKRPLASVAELKAAGIAFHPNPTPGIGIPQGTPISAALSNLYMVRFDAELNAYADATGGFYRRYSDDILFICHPGDATNAEKKIQELVTREGLQLNNGKTERTRFSPPCSRDTGTRGAQYLGFTLHPRGVAIRESSLSRQWRKMRRAIKRTRKAAEVALASGTSSKVFTKRLWRRFTAVPARNFPSYARRSAVSFGGASVISRQLRSFEKAAEREIRELKKLEPGDGSFQPAAQDASAKTTTGAMG
jgi:hypothetical protein